MGYKIFTGSDQEYEHIHPSIEAAKKFSQFLVKCANRDKEERERIAKVWGWDPEKAVVDEFFYEKYQQGRALILFEEEREMVKTNMAFIDVAEVNRAETNFLNATGLALKSVSLTLSDLTDYLNLLTQNSDLLQGLSEPTSENLSE